MNTIQLNGLALEYKCEYGTARRYVDVANVTDYPVSGRIGRIFGPGFFEQLSSLPGADVRMSDDNARDARLIRDNGV